MLSADHIFVIDIQVTSICRNLHIEVTWVYISLLLTIQFRNILSG